MEICSPSPAFQLISLTFILLVYLFPNLTSSSPYSLSHPKVTFPTTKYCSPTIQMRLKLLSLLIRVWGKGQIVKISHHLVKRVLHPEWWRQYCYFSREYKKDEKIISLMLDLMLLDLKKTCVSCSTAPSHGMKTCEKPVSPVILASIFSGISLHDLHVCHE